MLSNGALGEYYCANNQSKEGIRGGNIWDVGTEIVEIIGTNLRIPGFNFRQEDKNSTG